MEKIKKLWFYFSTYEKIWLFSILAAAITLAIVFPEVSGYLMAFQLIAVVGGCSCELLLSKQSKWAFIVSFVLYDIAQTVIYIANGFYVSALFEVIFWMPILFISFYLWSKREDNDNATLTKVRKIDFRRDILIFLGICAVSFGVGAAFTAIDGFSDVWYLDALANTFSVCNGLFLLLCYREQWFFWLGLTIIEAIMWIISGNFIMLVLSVGYLTNSIYGLVRWSLYIRKHPEARDNGALASEAVGAGVAPSVTADMTAQSSEPATSSEVKEETTEAKEEIKNTSTEENKN